MLMTIITNFKVICLSKETITPDHWDYHHFGSLIGFFQVNAILVTNTWTIKLIANPHWPRLSSIVMRQKIWFTDSVSVAKVVGANYFPCMKQWHLTLPEGTRFKFLNDWTFFHITSFIIWKLTTDGGMARSLKNQHLHIKCKRV